jgi:hypothetical protein
MGFNLKDNSALLFGDGNGKWSTTTLATIGLAVKNSLLKPTETENRYVYVNSFTVSQREVVSALEQVSGKKWTTTNIDAEEMLREGQEKLSKGDFSGAMNVIRYVNAIEGHGGNFATYRKTSNEVLELPKETLVSAVENLLKQTS